MKHGKIETRTWRTDYRGLVLICAAKKSYKGDELLDICGQAQLNRIAKLLDSINWETYAGHAVAVGRLVDCRPMTKADEDKCFVEYRPGLWCHVYEEVKPIYPKEFKGAQRWKNVSYEELRPIEFIAF